MKNFLFKHRIFFMMTAFAIIYLLFFLRQGDVLFERLSNALMVPSFVLQSLIYFLPVVIASFWLSSTPVSKKGIAIVKGSPRVSSLMPLPKMGVVRDIYCSQEITDKCIKYLEDKRPDLMKELYQVAKTCFEPNFSEVLSKMDKYLQTEAADKKVQVPETYLGRIDLFFELSRRFEKLYPLKESLSSAISEESAPDNSACENLHFAVRGKPFAQDVNGPYPSLSVINILPFSFKQGLTQGLNDRVIQGVYEACPQLFFYVGEEIRRDQNLYEARPQIGARIREMLNKENLSAQSKRPKQLGLDTLISVEINRLIRNQCGLPVSIF